MKRKSILMIISVLFMTLLAFFAVTARANAAYIKGDVNGNGKIDVTDAVKLRKHIFNIQRLTSEEFERADVCKDGIINIFDMVVLKDDIVEAIKNGTTTVSTTETTTSTTMSTTTTSTTTTSGTTTASSSSTKQYDDADELICDIVDEIQAEWWDGYELNVPVLNDFFLYNGEEANFYEKEVYAFIHDNHIYAYNTVGWEEQEKPLFMNPSNVAGAVLWCIDDYEGPPSKAEFYELPDYEGKIVINKSNNEVFDLYELNAYDEISYDDIVEVANYVIADKTVAEEKPRYYRLITYYDYNFDNDLTKDDLKQMIAFYMSRKPAHLQNYRSNPEEDFDVAFDYFEKSDTVKTIFNKEYGPFIFCTVLYS